MSYEILKDNHPEYDVLCGEDFDLLCDLDRELPERPKSLHEELMDRLADEGLAGDATWDKSKQDKALSVLQSLVRIGEYERDIAKARELTDVATRRPLLDDLEPRLKNEHGVLDRLCRQSSGSTERTPAQQRNVDLIEKVRELMQHELDTTWPKGQRGLKTHVINHHYPELQLIYSRYASKETMAGKTKPSACKKLGVPPLPA